MQPTILAMPPDDPDAGARLVKHLVALLADADLSSDFRLSLASGPFRAEVTIRRVEAAGVHAGARMLGELERRVVEALAAAGKPLVGKQIAKALGRHYDTDARFKYLLSLLVERGVLGHTDGGEDAGYWLPAPDTTAAADEG